MTAKALRWCMWLGWVGLTIWARPAWAEEPVRFYHVWAEYDGVERGTAAEPFTRISAALAVARARDYVRVATGPGIVYTETLHLVEPVHLQGGYDPLAWTRQPAAYSVLDGLGRGPVVVFGPWIQEDAQPVFEGFLIRNGAAPEGGGVLIQDASPRLVDNRITGNTALVCGGGVAIRGGAPVLIGNQIEGNASAQDGGGIGVVGGTVRALENRIVANEAFAGYGGGIYASEGAVLSLERNRLIANQGNAGAGLAADAGVRLACVGDGFALNVASAGGGGILASDATVGLLNVSMLGNVALAGGGMAGTISTTAVMTNCLFWEQVGGDLVGFEPTISHSDVEDRLWPGLGNRCVDPLLRGGVTTFQLSDSSPLVDMGWDGGSLAFDLDGQARRYDGDGDGVAWVDIGADEVAADLSDSAFGPLPEMSFPAPGGLVTWRFYLSNSGQVDAHAVTLTHTLPAGAWLVPQSISSTVGVVQVDESTVLWHGVCAVGASVEIQFVTGIAEQVEAGTWWLPMAEVSYGAAQPVYLRGQLLVRPATHHALPLLCR